MDKQTNQEISAEAFSLGWNKCRAWICKQYNLDEKEVIKKEEFDN